MHPILNRRRFITRTAGLAGMAAIGTAIETPAVEPIRRPGGAGFKLALAAYSLRDYMKHNVREDENRAPASERIDLTEFIDYCAEQGCQGAELTSYFFPEKPDPAFLLNLRRHAFLNGITISGSAVGNRFTLPDGPELEREIQYVTDWVRHTAQMGASHLRVFAGNPERGMSEREAREQCIRSLAACADVASKHGVVLGLENHGGIVSQADDLLQILNAVDHPWLRVNLDTGNFYSPHPYEDMEKLAPYAVNVQLKVEINRVPGGKEPTDLERVVNLLKEVKYRGFVALEYESDKNPWEAIPVHLKRLKAAIGRI